MRKLIERVKAATGFDAQIEWDVAEALGLIPEHKVLEVGWDHDWFRHPGDLWLAKFPGADDRAGMVTWVPPGITQSIDAALALVERKLPHAMRRVSDDPDGYGAYAILVLDNGDKVRGENCVTWPLAILAALLVALSAHPGTGEREG